MKTFTFKNGDAIPSLGFGTWQLTGDTAYTSTLSALEHGYTHIDTAEIYGNHKEVGKAIKESGITRSKLWVTSKLWRTDFKKQDVLDATKKALEDLGLDYLDLYLMHWPNKDVPLQETLEAMAQAQEQGLIKNIGVSNFTRAHLKQAFQTGIEIVNNQIEFHVSLNQDELFTYCRDNGLLVTGYSPLAWGQDLNLGVVQKVASKHSVSTAQVCIAWLLEKGIVAIPRSSNSEHIADNFGAMEVELDELDMEKLNELNADNRLVEPEFAEFDFGE